VAEILDGEQPGAQPVVEVVGVVGDVVGECRHLRLGGGVGVQVELVALVVLGDVGRRAAQRAVVLGQALERFPGEVQPVEGGVAGLQQGDHAQRLGVVVEAAIGLHGQGQCLLPGMAEGGVAEIMGQRQGLGEVLVEHQLAGDGAGDLRHLQAVCEAGAVEVALVVHEDLGLVLQAAEGGGVHDAVAVALPGGAAGGFGLGVEAAAGGFGAHRPGGEGCGPVHVAAHTQTCPPHQ
jgi:hypothetical protein